MSEDRVGCCDAKIASQRQIHAAAHAVAVDGGDHWNGKTVDGVHQPLASPGKLESVRAVELGTLVEIGAGGREFVVAGDDQSLDAAALGLPLQLTNICEQGRNGGAVEFVGLVSRNQLQYGTTMFTAPAKIVSNVNFGSISVHPRSSAVRFSRASVKIAAAQKEVTVWALEFATRFQHLCAAIGADRCYIGERRSSLRRWDADGFALSVHWANVQFRPSDGANPRSKTCGNTGYS